MSSVLISENSSCHIKLFFKKIWLVLIIVLLLHSLSAPEAVRRRDEIAFFDRIKINREVVQEARCVPFWVRILGRRNEPFNYFGKVLL